MRKRIKALGAAVYALLTSLLAFQLLNSSAQFTGTRPPGWPWMGDDEDYILSHSTAASLTSNITQRWVDWYNNISATWLPKYNYNTVRLMFVFANLNTSNSYEAPYNQTQMDLVIKFLASKELHVQLTDLDWAGFGSHTWVQDWRNVTAHYEGNTSIVAFEIFNEPTSSSWYSANVTTANPSSTEGVESAYSNCTAAVQTIDSSRWVIWNPAFFYMKLYSQFQKPNVVYTYHPTSKMTQAVSLTISNQMKNFQNVYNVPVFAGEINVSPTNASLTEFQISSALGRGFPFMTVLYFTGRAAYFNPVLNYCWVFYLSNKPS